MNTLPSIALEILERNNIIPYKTRTFMNHIVVEVPDSENFQRIFREVKESITASLQSHFPERDDNILFEVTSKCDQQSFKVYK